MYKHYQAFGASFQRPGQIKRSEITKHLPVDEILLRLLLDWCGDMRSAICRDCPRTAAIRLWRVRLCIISFVIIILINIHVTGSRLVMLRALLLGCLRHARQRSWCCTHWRKRGWMVGSLGRMVAVIESSCIWGAMWAVTSNLRRWHWMWRRRATTVWFFELLTLFIVRRRLGVDVLIIFPLAMPFRRCSWRTVIAIACSGFRSDHGRCWRGSAARDATAGRGVRMVLIWPLIAVAAR